MVSGISWPLIGQHCQFSALIGQDLWFRYCVSRGWTREMILSWVDREVARWGEPIHTPQFVLDM